ncbi:response regulator transcription factor [Actinomycetospora lutea]|uniref:response regulator transcription factor n=1 Tax=Actinomycetospora lutea TaxID=663604 RepID=UPI0023658CBA|nr:response regulator transcription factor [Actinomycetospora lutea]
MVDPNRIVAEVMAARLGAEKDIQVLRCAVGGDDFHRLVAHTPLDVVLADAGLFAASGIDEHRPRTGTPAIVLLADRRDRSTLVSAVRAGVRGWVPRSAPTGELLAAVRASAHGGTWLPPAQLTEVLGELVWSSPPEDPTRALLDTLTRREREVLSCLAEGLTRPEVAERLRMSPNTVRTHVQSTLAKLGVSSSLAAVALFRAAGDGRPDAGAR